MVQEHGVQHQKDLSGLGTHPQLLGNGIIIERPGLKRTTMLIQFQPPCYVQGRQPADQTAQSHIQPGLECLQGWGIHNLLGQPVLVRYHPLYEKLLPNIQPKPPLFQFKTIPSCPVAIHPPKQLHPFLFVRSLQILEGHNEVSPEPSLLQAEQAQFPQAFFIGEVLQTQLGLVQDEVFCSLQQYKLYWRNTRVYILRWHVIPYVDSSFSKVLVLS